MSPPERSQSQSGSERLAYEKARDNAPVLLSLPLPLRPLAPKPTSRFRPLAIRVTSDSGFASTQGQPAGPSRGRRDNRCAVCFKRECSLVSHRLRHESSSLRRQQTLPSLRTAISQDSFSASYSLSIAALYDDSSPSPTNLCLLDQLPIPADLDRAHMHQLFHAWFVVEAPKHFTASRPVQIKSDLLHGPFLAPAFNDPVLCLSILTVSAASRLQTFSNSNKLLALTLCDRAMSKLRERVIADRDTVKDTTIVAATYLWAANLYLSDAESLQQHASSVKALVEARAELQNLGLSEATGNLFKWVDIMNTLRLNRPCQFSDDRKLKMPVTVKLQSGSAWRQTVAQQIPTSDPAVASACSQCCQAIDILDQTEPEEMEASTYFYLFEKVAQLYQENSALRARYFSTGTLEECIVLAVDILKLLVFNGGWNRSTLRALKLQAHYLSTAVQATGAGNFWRTRIQIFIWLVFLVYISKPTGEQLAWSTYVLRGALEHHLGPRTAWSGDTLDRLQDMLFKLGWSYTEPLGDLEALCEELWA